MTKHDIIKTLNEIYKATVNPSEYQVINFAALKKFNTLVRSILNLINQQQEEIERLKIEKDNLIKTYGECQKDVLTEYTERLKIAYIDTSMDYYYIEKTMMKVLKEMVGEDK